MNAKSYRKGENMTENQTLNTIFNRSSYRGSFKNEPVPREDLAMILKAGIAAPSGCNRQTPSFIAVDEEELVKGVKQIFPNPSCQTAPAFILVFTQEIAGIDGHFYNVQDYGAAVENMLLAMKSLGYDSCWYEGGGPKVYGTAFRPFARPGRAAHGMPAAGRGCGRGSASGKREETL